jgi:hypothetical protein
MASSECWGGRLSSDSRCHFVRKAQVRWCFKNPIVSVWLFGVHGREQLRNSTDGGENTRFSSRAGYCRFLAQRGGLDWT